MIGRGSHGHIEGAVGVKGNAIVLMHAIGQLCARQIRNDVVIVIKDAIAIEIAHLRHGAGRFLAVEWPESVKRRGGRVTLDFNKAYNPPCAFSAYTTCPMPPRQNQLKVKVEAGEKFPARQVAAR